MPLIRDTADLLSEAPGSTKALAALRRTRDFLDQRLVPHEQTEETQLYPALAGPLGSSEATATMSRRMHAEIDRLSRRIGTHLALAEPTGASETTRSRTSSPPCTACTPCSACTSPRRRRTTSHSPTPTTTSDPPGS
ncbi:hemerythrin domain-containing protein [Saccharopolyspora sp. NPDC000995]